MIRIKKKNKSEDSEKLMVQKMVEQLMEWHEWYKEINKGDCREK